MQEERTLHEAKLAKMEAEMKMVFQQKVQEKETKLKQSEEELYARHREMKEQLEKQRLDLEDKKRRLESGRPLTPEKSVSNSFSCICTVYNFTTRLARKVSCALEPLILRYVCSYDFPRPHISYSPLSRMLLYQTTSRPIPSECSWNTFITFITRYLFVMPISL